MGTIRTSIQITDGFSSAFKSMNNALNVVMSSLERTQRQLGRPVDLSALNSARQELARAAVEIDRVGNEATQAANQQRSMNNAMREGQTAASGLLGKLKGIVAAYVGWHSVKGLISMSDEMANATSRLDLMNDGMQTTDELMSMIHDAANRSLAPLKDMTDLVGKLGITAADAFSNNQDIINFSEQLSKHMVIGGTTAEGKGSVMTQLSQALASGVLRGEEFNAVRENAPTVVKAIADYLGVANGKVKKLADDGKLSATIVKNALLAAADETNKKFNSMANTFSDIWTIGKNNAIMAFDTVWKRLKEISSGEGLKAFAENIGPIILGIGTALVAVINSIVWVTNIISDIFSVLKNNSEFVLPVLWGVAAALMAQGMAALWAQRQIVINAAMTAWKTVCDWAATAAIIAMEFAQYGLNAALAVCPLSWIIGLIIALVVVVYLAVAAFNHFAGTSVSATGIIAGAFMGLYGVIYNTIASLWNNFAAFAEFLINVFKHPVYSIKRLIANLAINFLDNAIAMTKGWDKFATSMANAIIDAVNWAIRAWNSFIDLLPDAVASALGLGKGTEIQARTSITSDLESAKKQIEGWAGEAPEDYISMPKMEYENIGETVAKGYEAGAKLADKFSFDGLKADADEIAKELGSAEMLKNANGQKANGYGAGIGKDVADNTKKTAKNTENLKAYEEEIKYLKEVGEREAINRFTTAEIKVNMNNQNTIGNNLDIDGVIGRLSSGLRDAMAIAAEGTHI